MAQGVAFLGQFSLPEAPEEYRDFTASLGFTLLNIDVLGLGGAANDVVGSPLNDSASAEEYQAYLTAQVQSLGPLSGFEEYMYRVGLSRKTFFINTMLLVFLVHVLVTAGRYAVARKYQGRSHAESVLGSRARVHSFTVMILTFYTVLSASVYQFVFVSKTPDRWTCLTGLFPLGFLATVALVAYIGYVIYAVRAVAATGEQDIMAEGLTGEGKVEAPRVRSCGTMDACGGPSRFSQTRWRRWPWSC